jgi:hypothetical protein
MNTPRLFAAVFGAALLAATALAADPSGIWKWTVNSPNGTIETTLRLTFKDGALTGTYSNTFGDATISNATVKDDAIAFEVVRDLGGNKFILKYQGTISGDAIKGTIEVPEPDGGETRKLDWNAKRVTEPAAPASK